MAEVTRRNVHGKDIVVTYVERDDLVSVKYIQDCQGNNGRFTPELLIESLGFSSETATMQFVRNNNLHKGGKALQGALLLINLRIGMIVKSVGSYILFQTLLPLRRSGFMIFNLMKQNRHYGCFLQQIHGPRLGILSSRRHGGNQVEIEPYPYVIDGNVYMSPFGPDFYVTLPIENIPPSVNGEFDSFQDNLRSTSFLKTSSHIKNLRNSQKANVLYVCADTKSLVKLHNHADMFYVPVGIALEDDVKRPWKCSDGSCDGRLYKHQDFIAVTKEQMNEIKQWGKLGDSEWCRRISIMRGQNRFTNLIVPSIDWSLNIVLVSQECLDEIYDSLTAKEKVFVRRGEGQQQVEMIFVQERKSITQSRGISISSWVLGDPQISRTRVTYPFTTAYKKTYGTGFGSRVRSQCLDSVNSYRDKRLNPRAHPSPLIHDSQIGEHQYFSHHKQRSCLLQMKLEMVLHSLTTNITFVAERINPVVVRKVSGLSTKFIATTGQSLYSFCNGLHTDTCDKITNEVKSKIFPNPTEDTQRLLSFEHCSFPTTCGYQHVWKTNDDAGKYDIQHYFVMPTLGLAVSLDDSICHHFQGGAFAHCTSVCVLYDEQEDTTSILNDEDKFRVFAWGSSANSRTVRANTARVDELGGHRDRTEEQRRQAAARRVTAAVEAPSAQSRTSKEQRRQAAAAQSRSSIPGPAQTSIPVPSRATEATPAAVEASSAQSRSSIPAQSSIPVPSTEGRTSIPAQSSIPVPSTEARAATAVPATAAAVEASSAQSAQSRTSIPAQSSIPVPLTEARAATAVPATAAAVEASSAQSRTSIPAQSSIPVPSPAPNARAAAEVRAAAAEARASNNGTSILATALAAETPIVVPPVQPEPAATVPEQDDHDGSDSEYENAHEFQYEDDSYEEEEPLEKKNRWFS